MPSADHLLSAVDTLAREWRNGAIAWHVVFGSLALLLLTGFRPPRRVFALTLLAPLLSVAVVSWSGANPFNAAMFSVVAGVLAAIAWRLPDSPIVCAARVPVIIGSALLAFGWMYPHFGSREGWSMFYAAPLGIIPCPTLAAVLGVSAIASHVGSMRWFRVLKAASFAYGVMGVFWLGVWIDVVLIAAPIALDPGALIRKRVHVDDCLARTTLHS